VHLLPSFSSDLNLPESLLASKEVLSIPVHPSLTNRQLKFISSKMNQIALDL
jgi:dTDP-4-amino-4,6-dideoxygalactose transaminase